MRGLRNLITRANFCLLFLQLSKTSLNSRKLSCTLKRQNPNSDNPGQTFTFKKGKNRRKQMKHRTGARAHATRAGRCGGSDSLSGAPRNLRMKRNERKYRHAGDRKPPDRTVELTSKTVNSQEVRLEAAWVSPPAPAGVGREAEGTRTGEQLLIRTLQPRSFCLPTRKGQNVT